MSRPTLRYLSQLTGALFVAFLVCAGIAFVLSWFLAPTHILALVACFIALVGAAIGVAALSERVFPRSTPARNSESHDESTANSR